MTSSGMRGLLLALRLKNSSRRITLMARKFSLFALKIRSANIRVNISENLRETFCRKFPFLIRNSSLRIEPQISSRGGQVAALRGCLFNGDQLRRKILRLYKFVFRLSSLTTLFRRR